jgi:polysaccharide export outer membrane protein
MKMAVRYLIICVTLALSCALGLLPVAAAQQSGTEVAVPEVSGVSSRYVIGPGDNLQVFVWRNPELSVTIPVRPDGRITTPLVEEMVASGKTAAELARDMEAILAEYIRSPKVNIIVTNPQSLMSEVKIVGQVRTPQGVPYRDGMTALDLVLAVGGMTEFASGNRAKVVRKVDGETVEIELRLDDLINKGELDKDVDLLPGDVVVVPESMF